jgi:hypothetical protein
MTATAECAAWTDNTVDIIVCSLWEVFIIFWKWESLESLRDGRESHCPGLPGCPGLLYTGFFSLFYARVLPSIVTIQDQWASSCRRISGLRGYQSEWSEAYNVAKAGSEFVIEDDLDDWERGGCASCRSLTLEGHERRVNRSVRGWPRWWHV